LTVFYPFAHFLPIWPFFKYLLPFLLGFFHGFKTLYMTKYMVLNQKKRIGSLIEPYKYLFTWFVQDSAGPLNWSILVTLQLDKSVYRCTPFCVCMFVWCLFVTILFPNSCLFSCIFFCIKTCLNLWNKGNCLQRLEIYYISGQL
jgi:hypothetical protein